MLKTCSECKQQKGTELFYKKTRQSASWTLANYSSQCKECIKQKLYAYRKANPDRIKSSGLQCRFRIGLAEYRRILKIQNNVCAICQREDPEKIALAVDHCHKTGKVRGLLCAHCNHALGKLQDSIPVLERAIEYLRR